MDVTPSTRLRSEPTETIKERMLELMRTGLDVHEPSTAFPARMERETIFDGSYDWHSCVIAHWALLVQARWDGDAVAAEWVLERLHLEDLSYESDTILLRGDRRVATWPYDEAWFLMLLSELEHHAEAESERLTGLRALRSLHESRLLEALKERSFPDYRRDDGRPPIYSGHYSSWLWTYLLVRWSGPITERGGALLDELRESKLLPARREFTEQRPFEPHPYDFLWLPTLFELEEPGWNGAYDPGALDDWPAEVSLRDVHILGRELSRVWPLIGTTPGNERVAALLDREDLWAGDFTVVSHWVPQYLFLGRWFHLRH